jgi:outer membrane receptor protein involved in Fe transport
VFPSRLSATSRLRSRPLVFALATLSALLAQRASAQLSSVDAGAPPAAPGPAPDAAATAPPLETAAGDGGVPESAVSADGGMPLVPPAVPVVPEQAPAAEPEGPATQDGKGASRSRPSATLRGTILSADDESPLDGATVYVRGSTEQVQTEPNGSFVLTLPAGTYQLSVIYPGYSTQNVSNVELRPNQTSELNLKLQPGSVALDEMVVTGSRIKGGIATLIAERRDSKAVADVIGAEQMQRSGDSNAAAALSRVTGITVIDGRWVIVRGMGERYSSMTLNGVQVASPDPTRRVVPLDIFPAGLIDSVVVQKSYTPDLPGEFGGGLVQLRSRDYPHDFLFNVNAALGGNFNTVFQDRITYQGGKTDFLGFDDGTRKLPDSFDDPRGKIKLESMFDPGKGYTQEQIDELGRQLTGNYNRVVKTTPPDATLGANVGNEWRLRYAKIGFVTGFGYRNEYRTIDNARFVELAANPADPNQEYLIDNYRQQVSLSTYLDWGVEFSQRQKLKFTTMWLRQTDDQVQTRTDAAEEGMKGTERTTLQWVERAVLLQQVSGKHQMEKLRDFEVDWRYAFGQASRYEPARRAYTYAPEGEDQEYNFATGSTTNASVYSDLTDRTHEGQIDLAQPFGLWRQLEGKVKGGALFYRRDREADSRTFEYVVSDSVEPRNVPPDEVITDANIGNGIEFREVTRPTDSYNAWMQVEAGYLNLDLPLHKRLDVSGGARLEHARIETKTFDPFGDETSKPQYARLDNLDVLPSAMATWRFIDDFQARFGYSRTLNRPDFRELSSSRYYDLESNMLWVGNENVKRALIENFDVRLEWYYTPDEVFSIGGFLKRFDDPIEAKLDPGQEVVYTVHNVDEAISYGFEVEGRKRFGFLAKVLNPLYLASNFSLIDSHVDVPTNDGTYDRPLQGQSPWVINAQLGWDDTDGTGTSASLLFNSAGKRVRIVGDPDMQVGDVYELPIHRMDFVFSQNLPHKVKLGARVRNILNAREVWKQEGQIVRDFRRGGDFQISCSWSY